MSCKTVRDRPLPRRLDRRAGRGCASRSAWNSLSGLALVLAQVGCMAEGGSEESPEIQNAKVNLIQDTGTLHGEHCIATDQAALSSYAVYTNQWVKFGANARVVGGDVGVRDDELTDSPEFQVDVGEGALIDETKTVTGKEVYLGEDSAVGNVRATVLTPELFAVHGTVTPFPDSTPIPPVVVAPAHGGTNRTIPGDNVAPYPVLSSATVWNNVNVGENSTLHLQGGTYQINNLRLFENAKVYALAPTTLVVTNFVRVGQQAQLKPIDSSGLTAKDLVIHAAAGDLGPASEEFGGETPAVHVGFQGRVRALIIAPNGYVNFAPRTVLRGAVYARAARWVATVTSVTSVTWEDGIVGEPCQPYDCSLINPEDNNPCTIDGCNPDDGATHDPGPDGTLCDYNGQDGACVQGVCEEICNAERQTVKGNPKLDGVTLAPTFPTPEGKYVVRYVSGCMKYNPLWWWSVNGSEDGKWAWVLIDDANRYILPGTFGFFNSTTPPAGIKSGFKEFADCVAANVTQATPLVFQHESSSQLGIKIRDRPLDDNRHGLLGQNPIWSITPFECSGQ